MQITTIKISQEINFNGMPTWIGLEAALLPGENEKDGLRSLQRSITEYQQEESAAFGKSRWASNPAGVYSPVKSLTEEMEGCATYAEIQSYRLTVKTEEEKAVYERKLTELSPKN